MLKRDVVAAAVIVGHPAIAVDRISGSLREVAITSTADIRVWLRNGVSGINDIATRGALFVHSACPFKTSWVGVT
ncbi:MAG: hypothetical protein ABGY96_27400 [bacterium]